MKRGRVTGVETEGAESEGENQRGGVGTFNIVLLFSKDVTFSCHFVSFHSVS
jgi:hypothetical protein